MRQKADTCTNKHHFLVFSIDVCDVCACLFWVRLSSCEPEHVLVLSFGLGLTHSPRSVRTDAVLCFRSRFKNRIDFSGGSHSLTGRNGAPSTHRGFFDSAVQSKDKQRLGRADD